MLREWAREKLVFESNDDELFKSQDGKYMPSSSLVLSSSIFDGFESIGVGSLLRSQCQG